MERLETAYETIGVPPTATQEEIASAFRRLARIHHPDRAGSTPENNETMAYIIHQYKILEDPTIRQQYDEWLQRQWFADSTQEDSDSGSTSRPEPTASGSDPNMEKTDIPPPHTPRQGRSPPSQTPRHSSRMRSSWCLRALVSLLLNALVIALFLPTILGQGSNKGFLSHFIPNFDLRTHYQILNVSSDASFREIRKSYHTRILQLHPDKTGNNPTINREFQKARNAYETLSDPIERCIYDNSWIIGDPGKFSTCVRAKEEITRAQQKQIWEDFLADQAAVQWEQEWRDILQETRDAGVGSIIPIVQEAACSIVVVVYDAYRTVGKWGGRLRVLIKTLMIETKLLVSF